MYCHLLTKRAANFLWFQTHPHATAAVAKTCTSDLDWFFACTADCRAGGGWCHHMSLLFAIDLVVVYGATNGALVRRAFRHSIVGTPSIRTSRVIMRGVIKTPTHLAFRSRATRARVLFALRMTTHPLFVSRHAIAHKCNGGSVRKLWQRIVFSQIWSFCLCFWHWRAQVHFDAWPRRRQILPIWPRRRQVQSAG